VTELQTGGAILMAYDKVIISINIRGRRVSETRYNDPNRPLGDFFGEHNRARDARVIQLGVKLNF